MLTENALVVEAHGHRALVKTHRGEACSSCQASGICRAMGGGKEMVVEVLNHLHAGEGDRVLLALPESSFVKASAVTYGIPLVGFLTGAITGQAAASSLGWSPDSASVVLGLSGLVVAIPIVAWLNRRLSGQERYIPRIIKILPTTIQDSPETLVEPGDR